MGEIRFSLPLPSGFSYACRDRGPHPPDRPDNLVIFGAVMALRYPTQTLRVAAHTPTLSILHFVSTNGSQRGPTYQTAMRNFACLRPPCLSSQFTSYSNA